MKIIYLYLYQCLNYTITYKRGKGVKLDDAKRDMYAGESEEGSERKGLRKEKEVERKKVVGKDGLDDFVLFDRLKL